MYPSFTSRLASILALTALGLGGAVPASAFQAELGLEGGPTAVVPDPIRLVDRYSPADLAYFSEVALGAEYGSSSKIVRKWNDDIRVQVYGVPTAADMTALQSVLRDLRAVMSGRSVEVVPEGGNVEIHFAPEADFHTIDANYQPTNYGFFWVWWSRDHRLVRSRILISSTDISQSARSHLIREELTQSLGLMNDSWRYPESIYYQGWTRTTEYAPIDLVVIEMLYRDEIQPGMSGEQALAVLGELQRPGF